MAQITYNVVPAKGGWCVSTGKVVGPPYPSRYEALRDAQFIAGLLRRFGDDVTILENGKIPGTPGERTHQFEAMSA